MKKKLRIVQWTSGSVARRCVPAIVAHPDLELVGLYAWSKDKVGRDAGELCGMPPLGIRATDDIDALLALKPDCVCYNALWPDVTEFERILGAGINIVTTSMFLTGWALGTKQPGGVPDAIERIEAAARKGNATIFGSGMNPGFASYLACILTGICTRFRHIRITESVDVSMFAGDGNMDPLGWGLPRDAPGHKARVMEETRVFADALEVMAAMLGVVLDDKRCTVDFAYATEDLALPGRHIGKGTVAAIQVRWEGVIGGRAVMELNQLWVMGGKIEPAWRAEHAYIINIDGEPMLQNRLDIWPAQDIATMQKDDFHGIGMTITGLPAVNAIPQVCAAPAGIKTYADLPAVAGHGRLRAY
jgi:2,4-diaminopentanoate dehydrogenase